MEAILIIMAAISNSIFNGVWSFYLSCSWRRAWGLQNSEAQKGPTPFLIAFIGSLWTSYGLFLIIKHIKPKNLEELMAIAIGAWLLILIGMTAKHYAFANKSMKELIIDYSQDLVSFILMSLIVWQI